MRLLRKLIPGSPSAASPDTTASEAPRTQQRDQNNRLRYPNGDSIIAAARAHEAAGRYPLSLGILDDALVVTPSDPALLFTRASTLFEWGRYTEALAGYRRASSLDTPIDLLDLQLGWSCFYSRRTDDAEAWMRKAIGRTSDEWKAHFGLGAVLQTRGKYDEAIACFERGLEIRPDDFDAIIMTGVCMLNRGDLAAAEQCFRRAIGLRGDSATAWTNLGVALVRTVRYPEALDAFERAYRVEAEHGGGSESFSMYAANLRDMGHSNEALALYDSNLPGCPSLVAHNNYSFALLTAGRHPEGWHHYESRWITEPLLSVRPALGKPMWSGQPLHGKTILLCAEQGIGDVIQFIRFAPAVKELGATVLLRVRTAMERVTGAFSGVDAIVDRSEAQPDFDYYIPLMGLPRVFGVDLASIPNIVPYLEAEPGRAERWRERLGEREGLRVGLVWAGNPGHLRDRFRSMHLRTLEPVLDVAGVQFYSLQKGAAAEQLAGFTATARVVDLGSELQDFGDTAAVISQLDLVICVDTAVAHLAGALGKPVWMMLPQMVDFRWMENREDSPWYPTMRLFRQRSWDDWDEVIRRVKAALEEQVAGGGMGSEAEAKGNVSVAGLRPVEALPRQAPGHRPGFSAVAECRHGILQYLPDEPLIGDAIGWYGEYREAELELLGRLIKAGSTVMEVGVGIGAHAVFLGRLLGETGHLFLYEARPVVKRILQQNLGANRIGNYTLMRRMLGPPGETAPGAMAGTVTETLDELRLERLDWLKSNETVSAAELLDGAGETLWRLRPRLLLSAPDEAAVSEVAQRVREFGYRCWRMATPLFNPDNFNRRENDIFSGRIGLAVLAIPEEIEVDVALDQRSATIEPLA